jgi:ABC-type branched-subunit amino acid transport system ATPase component
MSNLLEIRDVVKAFGGVVALDGVSASVAAGAITAVIGPNGSGKTSLMNVITGFYRSDRGSVKLDGQEIAGLAPHRIARAGIARTFQHIRLFEGLSVLDNVLVAAERKGLKDAHARTASVLEVVGLTAFAASDAAALPYGHRRRLEIARALAIEPRVVILDEPAAGMNATEKGELGALLRRISATGKAVVLVEHDMDLVMDISDHVIALNFGRALSSGTPDQVRQDPQVIEAYLGQTSDDDDQAA